MSKTHTVTIDQKGNFIPNRIHVGTDDHVVYTLDQNAREPVTLEFPDPVLFGERTLNLIPGGRSQPLKVFRDGKVFKTKLGKGGAADEGETRVGGP